MTARSGKAAAAESASAFNRGDGTAMVGSVAEMTLQARTEVSAQAWANSSSCSKGRGTG